MRLPKSFLASLLGTVFLTPLPPARAAEDAKPAPVVAEAREKAAALVARMTLEEKLGQLVNVAPAIPRLGIPAYNWWTESLHGAIGAVPTTNFPEPIGLAATFDTPLIHDVAAAVSQEVRALHTLGRDTGHLGRIGTGLDTWSPNINIFRDPRWGRGQETYGEDPYLTARLAVAFVGGMQGPNPDLPDVVATPKHFAVHSGPESTRHTANVYVSPHDLEDTYLPAFRAAIVDARAGSIMCAYNRINGQPACASDLLLKERLRGAWHFTGYVVSDCDAVKDIADNHKYAPDPAAAVAAAVKAGVDNECNVATLFGGGPGLADRYREAFRRGLISAADIDLALLRLFSARYRNGDLAGLNARTVAPVPVQAIGTAAHRQLALTTAAKSLVLLKNDGVLPLKPGLTVAVIGPHGDSTRVLRGNYSSSLSAPPVSLLDGLRQSLAGARVIHVPFQPTPMDGDPVPTAALQTPDGGPGVLAQYFNAVGEPKPPAPDAPFGQMPPLTVADQPVVTRTEPIVGGSGHDLKAVADQYRVVWSGFLVPPESGTYRLGLAGFSGDFEFDGRHVDIGPVQWGELPKLEAVTLERGRRYPIRIATDVHGMGGAEFLWKRVSTAADAAADQEVRAAIAGADVVVAAVGLSSDLEGEEMKRQIEGFAGGDKTSLDLPAEQRHLLEVAKQAGKPLVVVLLNGSPLDLSWAKDNASAILEAWYPGQAGGQAIADVLSGKADPAGRLPLTFYHSVADLPPFDDYAMTGRTYRYFTGQAVYPFGFGLSYSRYSYGPLTVQPVGGRAENGVRVTATVTNTGGRAGEEVAQLYLKPPAFDGAPRLALRGFQRLSLAAGESRTVSFDLSPRDLSFVTREGDRQVMAGAYEVSVGSGQPDTGVAGQHARFTTAAGVPLPR
ncbi:glycoside hydrolase family 3 C-terminal domain-containing protein [Nitrospirillum iridis]|uniref:Beta-glucosidase n=1 Tax=Nitrospirillum iridis TaxID=765888 RepID=A0A7X0EE65_9PROT|nr:glycoside hydrolase family 3 C-terminal domain-containing protein [Nitrospirillum iridis]MBB6251129.1 beta-glucosidase [Nitrospirillum iridis]